uniref:Sepallata 3 n=1 Tax=Annona squamosa TaxID=301693 RepID=A0A0M4RAT2_ANNSQ|nr:sepallata 3 [Annona squamosa]
MGRGRVELKRIENKVNRQVTFAKRRNGLLKKAYELSVLCDAEVALIIFSNRGKLYEFCSSSSMTKTLERYQKCNYGTPESAMTTREIQSSYQEYLKLKVRVEALQRSQRNLLGEDLGGLSDGELETLERQLETSLRQIRSTRTQQLLDQLSDLQKEKNMLREANQALGRRLEEGMQANTSQAWDHNPQDMGYVRQTRTSAGDGHFHQLDCGPTLQIGYQPDQIAAMSSAAGPSSINYQPGWPA